jgi:hypothetical protein
MLSYEEFSSMKKIILEENITLNNIEWNFI